PRTTAIITGAFTFNEPILVNEVVTLIALPLPSPAVALLALIANHPKAATPLKTNNPTIKSSHLEFFIFDLSLDVFQYSTTFQFGCLFIRFLTNKPLLIY